MYKKLYSFYYLDNNERPPTVIQTFNLKEFLRLKTLRKNKNHVPSLKIKRIFIKALENLPKGTYSIDTHKPLIDIMRNMRNISIIQNSFSKRKTLKLEKILYHGLPALKENKKTDFYKILFKKH
jgi:hypothetical protein